MYIPRLVPSGLGEFFIAELDYLFAEWKEGC